MSDILWPHGLHQAKLPCPSLSPEVYSNSCLLSLWWHSAISSFVVPFSCLQSFPASGYIMCCTSLLSYVGLFETWWTVARQAPLSKGILQSIILEWVAMPSSREGVQSVQSLSRVQLFVTPWIAARQASLSITNSQSLLKPVFIESVLPFSHLILCSPLLLLPQSLPASGSFPIGQLFTWGGQSIGVSTSASVLPVNTQDWSPLGWTGWISLQSKGLSRDFSNTTFQKHQFFGTQLSSQSNSHIHIWPLEKP